MVLFVLFHIRWLKKYGVHTRCEQELRKEQSNIIGNNIISEWLPFLFENQEGTMVKSTPCITVKSLKEKVEQQLEGYQR